MAVKAVTVDEAGSLSSILNQTEAQSPSLTVDGEIDAADIVFLASLPDLEVLDLSGAKIVEYDGARLITGAAHSDADRLPDYAFVGSKIHTITLPAGLRVIGEGALAGSKIVKISIPAGVVKVGRNAFADCDRLVEVTVPVTEIAPSTFRGCTSLKKVTLTNGVTSIGASAFAGCTALEEFPFGTALVAIGADAFNSSGLAKASLATSKALKTIGDRAFAHCVALTEVSLPRSVESLGQGLFFDDVNLAGVDMSGNVNIHVLPAYMFKGDKSLQPESLPSTEHITAIGDYALADIPHIGSYTFPAALDSIGEGAMEGWTSLRSLYANGLTEVPALGDNVWAGVDQGIVCLYVNENMVEKFMQAPQWRDFVIDKIGAGVADVDAVTTPGVDVSIEASTLKVEASAAVKTVMVYDTAGRFVAHGDRFEGTTGLVSLDHAPRGVLIVAVVTGDNPGVAVVVKLRY